MFELYAPLMALGGVKFKDQLAYPMLSTSYTELWSLRWNIRIHTFLKNCIYKPSLRFFSSVRFSFSFLEHLDTVFCWFCVGSLSVLCFWCSDGSLLQLCWFSAGSVLLLCWFSISSLLVFCWFSTSSLVLGSVLVLCWFSLRHKRFSLKSRDL